MKRPLGMGCALALATLVTLLLRAGELDQTEAITKWLGSYDEALNAKDIERLGSVYHPEVTIFEGGSTNDGWADYRDNHLGPELEELQGLQFSHFNVKAHSLGRDGRAAYVTIDIAREAVRMHADGVAAAEIRRWVEEHFGPRRGERAP